VSDDEMNRHMYRGDPDIKQAAHQYAALHVLWEKLQRSAVKAREEGTTPIHIPPAMYSFIDDGLDVLAQKVVDHADILDVPTRERVDQAIHRVLPSLMVWMFRLGQDTLKLDPPLRFEDLVACQCGELTERDLNALLGTDTPE